MSKKVLIVEQSLAVRGVAESLLRQHGYEVFAVDSAEAARQILHGSKIDLLMVASDITDRQGKPYFEQLGTEGSTAVIPLLVLHDPTGGIDLGYPPEAIINKPFTPKVFMESVAAFTGGTNDTAVIEQSPFEGADFEEEMIDTALGLDKIEVDDTEVIDDDTSRYRIQKKKHVKESMIGFEFKASEETTKTGRKKIEAISLPATPPEKGGSPSRPPSPVPESINAADVESPGSDQDETGSRPSDILSESSKLEIISDQYGIVEPQVMTDITDSEAGDQGHDYDWFLKEMQKENEEKSADSAQKDSGSIPLATPSEILDPSVPPPSTSPESAPDEARSVDHRSLQEPEGKTSAHSQAVDKFISEFKKEMETISSEAPPVVQVKNIAPSEPKAQKSEVRLEWQEVLERISPADIKIFTEELVRAVSAKIAERIVDQLDQELIYRLLKESVDGALQRLLEKRSQ